MDPADASNDPACAQVVVHLPDTVGPDSSPQQRRETDAQGTGAWGTPSTVSAGAAAACGAVSTTGSEADSEADSEDRSMWTTVA